MYKSGQHKVTQLLLCYIITNFHVDLYIKYVTPYAPYRVRLPPLNPNHNYQYFIPLPNHIPFFLPIIFWHLVVAVQPRKMVIQLRGTDNTYQIKAEKLGILSAFFICAHLFYIMILSAKIIQLIVFLWYFSKLELGLALEWFHNDMFYKTKKYQLMLFQKFSICRYQIRYRYFG